MQAIELLELKRKYFRSFRTLKISTQNVNIVAESDDSTFSKILLQPPKNSVTDAWVDEEVSSVPDMGSILDEESKLPESLSEFLRSSLPPPYCYSMYLPPQYVEAIISLRGSQITSSEAFRQSLISLILKADRLDSHLSEEYRDHLRLNFPCLFTSSSVARLEQLQSSEGLASFIVEDILCGPASTSFVNVLICYSPSRGVHIGGFVIWRLLPLDCNCNTIVEVQYILIHPALRGVKRSLELLYSTKIDVSRSSRSFNRLPEVKSNQLQSRFGSSTYNWQDAFVKLERLKNGWFFRDHGTSFSQLLIDRGATAVRIHNPPCSLLALDLSAAAETHQADQIGMFMRTSQSFVDSELKRLSSLLRFNHKLHNDDDKVNQNDLSLDPQMDWKTFAETSESAIQKAAIAREVDLVGRIYSRVTSTTYHWNCRRIVDQLSDCASCALRETSVTDGRRVSARKELEFPDFIPNLTSTMHNKARALLTLSSKNE